MSKNLLLYKTKWGATRQYADWIKEEEPSLVLEDLEHFDCAVLDDYYKVVIGSRVYMGEIMALDFIQENWVHLKEKSVYLFTVGLIPPGTAEDKASYRKIPEEIRTSIAGHTKMIGKIEMEKLNALQKTIVKFRKIDTNGELDKTAIEPVVSFLKGYEWKVGDSVSIVQM